MTPKILLLLGLSLVFAACDKETDITSQIDGPSSNVQSDKDLSFTEKGLFREDTCIGLSTTHWLSGNLDFRPVNYTTRGESTLIAKRYIITATGDAMSPEFARGLSQLDLVYIIYHNGGHQLSGSMVTHFYYGEIMEMNFDGKAKCEINAHTTNLQMEVVDAKLRTEAEVHGLADGEITFILTIDVDGKVKIDIETSSLLCIE